MTAAEVVLPIRHRGQTRVWTERQRFNVLAMGRRWGKSVLVLDLLLDDPGYGALDGHPVAWFAGTSKIFDEVWRLMLQTLPKSLIARTDTQKHRIELLTGGLIDFWSLDGGDAGGAGRGRKYRRVAIDEAALVPNMLNVWSKAIRPTLADLRGDAWFASTPRGIVNDFHDLWQRGQPGKSAMKGWKSWQLPTGTNPHLSREELADLKAEYAGRPLDYRQEILAEFVADMGAVFNLEWINEEKMPAPWALIAEGKGREVPKGSWPVVAQAWDLAGTKQDHEDKGCESVGVTLARDWLQRWWLLDVVRGKWDGGELVERMLAFAWKWRAQAVYGEDPVALYLEPFMRKRMQQSGKHVHFERVSVQGRGDKVARAKNASVPVMANGSFYVPMDAPWLPLVRQDLAAFPAAGKDFNDALSLGLAEAMDTLAASPPPPSAAPSGDPRILTWDDLERTAPTQPRRTPWSR